jgi:hypothetical protein
MFNVALIDSLKIRVRLSAVQVIDRRMIENYIEYYPNIHALDDDGGEIYDRDSGKLYYDQHDQDKISNKAKPLTKIINGITYRVYIKAFIDSQKMAQEYVVFQISAKMAKSDYFSGVTIKNLPGIVEDINALGWIHITQGTLLQGLISDIDICINQLIDEKSLRTAFAFINAHPNPGKKPLLHTISRTKYGVGVVNLGIDFNKREKATNTTPYCKIYHKGYELLNKSVDFYKAYLEPLRASMLDNLVRYEFTIKAARHKRYLCDKGFNADFKTLADLLAAREKDLRAIARSGIPHYVEPLQKPKTASELNPTQIVLQYYIKHLVQLGFDQEQLLGFTYCFPETDSGRVQKSQMKSKMKKFIEEITADDKKTNRKILENGRANSFLKALGII